MAEVILGSLRMLSDRLLVRPLEWDGEDVHGEGSLIVATRHGRAVRGSVVAVGPGRYPFIRKGRTPDGNYTRVTESKFFQPTEVKVGDMVEYGCLKAFDGQSYQFEEILLNGVKHVIITERDVTGVWKKQAVATPKPELALVQRRA